MSPHPIASGRAWPGRLVATIGAVSIGAVLLLTGCTDAAPPPSTATASDPNPTPDDGDESQDQWAHLKTLVAGRYPDAEFSTVGSSAQATSFHLSPPATSGTTGLAFAVSCIGGGAWSIRVDQEHPRTVRGTCDGPDPDVPDAVALDAHTTGAQIRVSPPDGTRFWMVAFYTKE